MYTATRVLPSGLLSDQSVIKGVHMDTASAGSPRGPLGWLSAEVAFVLAEELTVGERPVAPRRRVAPEDVQSVLATRPIKVVLDRLETRMSFDASHDWVMRPQPALDGVRPVDALAKGCVREVLSAIEQSPPA
jgi:hypothetical protein